MKKTLISILVMCCVILIPAGCKKDAEPTKHRITVSVEKAGPGEATTISIKGVPGTEASEFKGTYTLRVQNYYKEVPENNKFEQTIKEKVAFEEDFTDTVNYTLPYTKGDLYFYVDYTAEGSTETRSTYDDILPAYTIHYKNKDDLRSSIDNWRYGSIMKDETDWYVLDCKDDDVVGKDLEVLLIANSDTYPQLANARAYVYKDFVSSKGLLFAKVIGSDTENKSYYIAVTY